MRPVKEGYRLLHAYDGEQAIELARDARNAFDAAPTTRLLTAPFNSSRILRIASGAFVRRRVGLRLDLVEFGNARVIAAVGCFLDPSRSG